MRVRRAAPEALLAAALSAGPASATTVGVSIAHFDENFPTLTIGAIEAEKTGTVVQFEHAQGDTQRQLSQVQNFAARHVDAMIVNAVDSAATAKMTEAALAAKIPLVCVDRAPDAADLPAGVTFVSSDEHVSGRLQGEAIARALGGRGNVVVMVGELSDPVTRLRTEGVEKVVAQHTGMRVIAVQPANYQRAEAIDLMGDWITAGEKIDAVAANNDEMAIGAILALQQAHMVAGEKVPDHVDVPFELVTRDNDKSYVGR